MGLLKVVFDVPPDVQARLASGSYRFTGGVVRDAVDGQKIALHLKEAHAGRLVDPSKLPALLSSVGAVASVANLAVSVAGFALVLHKLAKIESQLRQLEQQMGQLTSKVDEVLAITARIEKLGWARLQGKLHSAVELAQRATTVQSKQLATHHVADALASLSAAKQEFRLLSQEADLPPPVRITAAQMALFADYTATALYARVDEEAAAVETVKGLEQLAADVRAATQVAVSSTPLAAYAHPRLLGPRTMQTMQELFGWSDEQLNAAMARSLTDDLGRDTADEEIPTLLRNTRRLESDLTIAAARGKFDVRRDGPRMLAAQYAAERSVALTQSSAGYALQLHDGIRRGLGPAPWDSIELPDIPEDAEVAMLAVG